VGNRGFVELREQARGLRAASWTLQAIAEELGVVKSTVSRWVADVEFVPAPRSPARRRAPNRLQRPSRPRSRWPTTGLVP
jgi:DNA-binding transcriptional regulator YdaS (Cro superfamily)